MKRKDWKTATARIYSSDWIDPSRDDFGHYDAVYTYRVDEEIYRGEFSDYRPLTDSYLKQDDMVEVKYDPSNPNRSYYPDAKSAVDKRLLFAGIGAALAIIVLVIVYLNGGFK